MSRNALAGAVLLCAAQCFTGSVARAQVVYPTQPITLTLRGSVGEQLGGSVHGAGDVNNDGYDDLIIGSIAANGFAGKAVVLSGADGTVLYTFQGDAETDYLGCSVSGGGDVNNDGFDDVIVGAFGDDNNDFDTGSARVFSGADGSVLYTFNGDTSGCLFGSTVSDTGDVNHDGFDDVIVGAYGDDTNGEDAGVIKVFSGANGSVLHVFHGDSAFDLFGFAVSGAGDVNGDGFDDFIVGASGVNGGVGRAIVYSGANGSVLRTFNGAGAFDYFGASVSGAGDVNNDGFDDVICSAPYADAGDINNGIVRVFSGFDGSVLHTFSGAATDQLGIKVGGAGDVDGDGFDDVICGAPYSSINGVESGYARVYSGASGATLRTYTGDSGPDTFGTSVGSAGDVNHDGLVDLIMGAPRDSGNGLDSGYVFIVISAPGGWPNTSCIAPPQCLGDADANHAVNFSDITTVLANFGLSCP